MRVSSILKAATVAAVVGWAAFTASAAQAGTILTFGQKGNANILTATNNGAGATTLSISGATITVSQLDSGSPTTPFDAILNLTATSTNAANVFNGTILQSFGGSFTIKVGGTNILSGTFTDFFSGSGSSATLGASTPPNTNVTFTSDVIAPGELGFPLAMALSFANVTPALSTSAGSVASFTSSVSGTFSANPTPVPEPASLLILGAGLAGLGLVRRKRG